MTFIESFSEAQMSLKLAEMSPIDFELKILKLGAFNNAGHIFLKSVQS